MLQRLARGGRTAAAARDNVRAFCNTLDAEHAEGSDTDEDQEDLDEDSDYYESGDEDQVETPATAATTLVLLPLTPTAKIVLPLGALPPRGPRVHATPQAAAPLHAVVPIVAPDVHAPPQAPGFVPATCNCLSAQHARMCVCDPAGGMLWAYLDDERALAVDSTDHAFRDTNNVSRKRMYRHGAAELGFLRLRRPLPNCYVAAVRCIWPSATGLYMGFKAH